MASVTLTYTLPNFIRHFVHFIRFNSHSEQATTEAGVPLTISLSATLPLPFATFRDATLSAFSFDGITFDRVTYLLYTVFVATPWSATLGFHIGTILGEYLAENLTYLPALIHGAPSFILFAVGVDLPGAIWYWYARVMLWFLAPHLHEPMQLNL
ncbi:uncharacterized protein BDZ99DRAFT_557691 [Mytilinidion resinicola]|uniref:Uncharacterized protein n=1 Tax=Mytilinidion resinicola TaxID=574789 RepID=A0A6A6YT15_9PEZI|nr:uncharacterized protein BDZ99DRAFT_557691 [Mytilinidion resinicola]KAF2812062.1 hypothetical protein BDZ99DRAFT_557691 [Mytilinidion resinicola]